MPQFPLQSWGPLCCPEEPAAPQAIVATTHRWDLRDHLLPPARPGPISCPINPNPISSLKRSWQCSCEDTPSCPVPQNPWGTQVPATPSCSIPLPAQLSSSRSRFWRFLFNTRGKTKGRILLKARRKNRLQGLVPEVRAPLLSPESSPLPRLPAHKHGSDRSAMSHGRQT